jgi:ABC-type antimicrobial peptide transport system permease subunit
VQRASRRVDSEFHWWLAWHRGATTEGLASELTTLARRLPERFGGSANYARLVQTQLRAVVRPLEEQMLGQVARPLWVLLGAVAIVLVIACADVANLFTVRAVGLYGVLSYVVAERTREIGVRMALGARADQVTRMVVSQGARVVGVGIAVGVIAALASTRVLGALLYGVAALDLTTFLAMSGSMVLVGLLASYLPARRASNVDPMESLRSE